MTDSNRVRVAVIKETTLGALPATPRMRTARITGESLNWTPAFFTPNELRADRMSADPTKINERNDGGINFEWSYPAPLSALSILIEAAMLAAWTETPSRDNDGTADSVITQVTAASQTVTVTSGAAFVASQLVRQSGFTNAANNGTFKISTGGTTSYICTGAGMVDEAAPPATARSKVIGCEGGTTDISATASGLASSTINFVSMGIVPGMWIKVGGTASAKKFATAALNTWIRATSVSANAIVADHLPAGWTTDAGTGKTIRLFFGDYIRNGTTLIGLSIERSFLGQTTPTHILQTGMCVDRLSFDATTEQAITGALAFMGMIGSQGTSANGNSYAAATTGLVFTGNVSIGSIALAGTTLTSPNWVRSLQFEIANNLRTKTADGAVGAVDIGVGEVAVTGRLETYFGSNTLLAQLMAGTPGVISARAVANSQAVLWTLPRVTFNGGQPNAGGKNQDVVLPLDFETSIDTAVTNAEIDIQRVEYFEA